MASVAGIVRDGERLLLVRQSDDGVWSTPGGVIELDDTPSDAVVREVWEEVGVLVEPRRLIGVYGGPAFVVQYPNGDETQYITSIFECEIVAGEPHAGDDEVTEVRFWNYEDARSLKLSPWLPRVLEQLYDRTLTAWFEEPTWRPPENR
jgi:ADP-ribose pyrophosphatase YjhB (NUDIX family)